MLVSSESRPRNLKWYHAGPLLFGDWGTSRLYVLGLAFFYTAHASALYLAAMAVLMAGVAWAYSIICRTFQEGGGVYAVARLVSHTLSVLGATLLLCDYTVTVALSIVDGLHYFGVPQERVVLTRGLAIGVIAGLGVINWIGARSAGRFALIVALGALSVSFLLAVLSIPYFREGFVHIGTGHASISSPGARWGSFVHIVLALSGVEAVANMTGLMKKPVPRTAKRTIWPVLAEVVLLNLFFGIAISGLPALAAIHKPDYVAHQVEAGLASEDVPQEVKEYRDTALKVLAEHAGHRVGGEPAARALSTAAGVVFGLLLLSAANTAIMAMVSVLFAVSQDRELPRALTRLNYSGVPRWGLLIACGIPSVLLLFMSDVGELADLYAVGVCGAITISLLGCVVNRRLAIRRWERTGMLAIGVVMLAIEGTIIVTKPHATLFAGILVVLVLGTRQALRWMRPKEAPPALPAPAAGWLATLPAEMPRLDPSKPKIMLAARGRYQSEFAVDLARRRGGALFAIYVRTLRLMDVQPGRLPRVEDDPEAQESLGTTALVARQAGVAFVPIYVTSADIAGEILDYTVTYGCDTLIMGKSRRSMLSRTVHGDVVAQVAEHLPEGVSLLLRSAETPFHPGSPGDVEELTREENGREENGREENGREGTPPT
jgi:amino acid transporter/nucleotide-binding universal stress UspA family protein